MARETRLRLRLVLSALSLGLVLTACGGAAKAPVGVAPGTDPAPAPSTQPATAPGKQTPAPYTQPVKGRADAPVTIIDLSDFG